MTNRVTNIAGYQFKTITDVHGVHNQIQTLCAQTHLKGTIFIGPEGINLGLAGSGADIEYVLQRLDSTCGFGRLQVNTTYSDMTPFKRLLVKVREELVPAKSLPAISTADFPDPAQPAYITSERLRQWFDSGQGMTLLDLRNSFEYELGSFDHATHLGLRHFRELGNASNRLAKLPKDRPVVTFCTGGIRCERGAPYIARQGFEQVYKLKGGVLDYLGKFKDRCWHGDCFVFDDRVTLDCRLEPTFKRLCRSCQTALNENETQCCEACARSGADSRLAYGTGRYLL
ncbi:MAG: rhodanese-like domain-containing protein [Gammaproteobacteria bacterium]|nr:rhodanese-like domain-containing protein [Gammaproteobacteria bacterium]